MYFRAEFRVNGSFAPAALMLKSHPVAATVDLNQWIRFDQPGDYVVRAASSCVLKSHGPHSLSLSSSIVLHIVTATPEWQDTALESMRSNLGPCTSECLRYMATPGAVDEMTSRLREDKFDIANWWSLGLIGLPDSMREAAIVSMNKRINEPDFPVSRQFFFTLSFLHVAPGSEKESIQAQREAIDPVLWMAVFSSLAKKNQAARAKTV